MTQAAAWLQVAEPILEAEDMTRRSHEVLFALLDALGIGAVAVNARGHILALNDTAAEILTESDGLCRTNRLLHTTSTQLNGLPELIASALAVRDSDQGKRRSRPLLHPPRLRALAAHRSRHRRSRTRRARLRATRRARSRARLPAELSQSV